MLKRLFAGLTRQPAPAPDTQSAWRQYEAGDLYPPHEFAPLHRDSAAHLALAAFSAGRFGDALYQLDACAIDNVYARTCVALLRAHVLRELLRFEDALAALDQAIAAAPDALRPWAMRCETLYCLGRFGEAQRDFDRPRTGAGPAVRGWALLGAQLADARGDVSAAISGYRESLAMFPQIALARSNLGYALLRAGMHRAGYEELRRVAFETGFLPMEPGSPVWAGEALDARPLLLVAEFGLGDMVQFLRYAGVLRQRIPGTPLWLKAPPTLHRAAQATGWFDRIVGPEFRFDGGFHSPLMQLPPILGAESELQPVPFPYLRPAACDAERFARLLGKPREQALVGLCWAGKPIEIDARRSVPLAALAPALARVAGRAILVSLQLGPARDQADALPAELRPIDLAPELSDVAASAALCAQLDLVVSVDTAAAHIAGASATPLWLLARPDVEYRWEVRGTRDGEPVTGYYPHTRVFRHPGGSLNWNGLVGDLADALDAWVEARAMPR